MSANPEEAMHALLSISGRLAPDRRLSGLAQYFSSGVVFTTSFGLEDQMITHLIATQNLPFRIITLDTGRFFPETYDLWQRTEEKYGLRIHACYPDSATLAALVADQGINGFYYSVQMRKACCKVRKVEPLERALAGAAVWITGLRRGQSQAREKLGFVTLDQDRKLLKINPLHDLGRDEVMAYTQVNDIPVNTLHAAGFPSIGCAPCTRAVQPGEDERTGRWWWETDSARECGLHVSADKVQDTTVPQGTGVNPESKVI